MSKSYFLPGNLVFAITLVMAAFQTSIAGVITLAYGTLYLGNLYDGDGGPATSAYFLHPASSWINTMGEAFIADHGNGRVRKVDSSGIISSYFGPSGSGSSVIGSTTPNIITGDTVGNIYIANEGVTNYVYKIDTSLTFSLFAGGGDLGFLSDTDEGQSATTADFGGAVSIGIDSSGNMFIGDFRANKIKKVPLNTGIISYVAGTGIKLNTDISANNGDGGQATAASVSQPRGIFVDTSGLIFCTSFTSGIIRRINIITGIIVTFAGGSDGTSSYSGDGGAATSAHLEIGDLETVTRDQVGRVYYCVKTKHNVRVIDTSGIINRFAGTSGSSGNSGNGGEATAALLYNPWSVHAHGSAVYISDSYYNTIRAVAIELGTSAPSIDPSTAPSLIPTTAPSEPPSTVPSISPTALPTIFPSVGPSFNPTLRPTLSPSTVPTVIPTCQPSIVPSCAPTVLPSLSPTLLPSTVPSDTPTPAPTTTPSMTPTTAMPTLTFCPSVSPTATPRPSVKPTNIPTVRPSRPGATVSPTAHPTVAPTLPIVVISFDSNLYLHNVTASSLDVTSQSAITSSVAVTLNISNNQVSYVSQQLIGSVRRRLSGVIGYQILVTVSVTASTSDFEVAVNQNGTYLYQLLVSTLTDAVESNAFAVTVRETSAALGAVSTLFVGYANVTMTDFTDVTPSSDTAGQGNDSGLSGGAIAGIVIGGVAALVICLTTAVYRNRKRESRVVASPV